MTIWHDDFGADSGWGGRAVVRLSDSLVNDVGRTCTIRWPVSGGGHVAGEFVLSARRVGEGALLRSRIGGQADAPLRRVSDRLGEFGKRHGDSKPTRSFGGDFVLAATQVLHEGESGDDDRGRAVGP